MQDRNSLRYSEATNTQAIESDLRLRARQIDELIDRARERKLQEELSACLTRQPAQNRRTWTY